MYGRFFEDFSPGKVIRHWPGRTINEADNTWFSLMTQNQHPLHIDAHYAASHTQHGRQVVVGTLVFAVAVGQTVADLSGRAIANLEYESITHDGPVYHGDTIYCQSRVLDVREASRGDRGVVGIETEVTNQHGEKVMSFRRKMLVPKKSHTTLGEGKLPCDARQ